MGRPVVNRYYIARKQAVMQGRTRLWQAMRILREFTAHELCATCETKIQPVRNFVNQLRIAGFVIVAHKGDRARHVPARYRLIRNTGPKCPALVRGRRVFFDPNTDQEYPL